jgi:hypothetical protein
MRGRWAVLGIVLLGGGLAAAAALLRRGAGPRLPLRPGLVLLVTARRGTIDLEPLADGAVSFPRAHGVSSDPDATLGAIVTGRMPRESGLVRAGDAIARQVPVLAELLDEAGFEGAAISAAGRRLRESGVFRGCRSVEEAGSGGAGGGEEGAENPDLAAAACEGAADWLIERRTAPGFCHLHLAQAGAAALRSALERLRAAGAGERLVIAAVAYGDLAAPQLVLRLPPGLLPRVRDERNVSLLDVVPTLLECFGLPGRPGLMEPWLLGPRSQSPRCLLFAVPLEPPPPEQEGCDAVTLLAPPHRYSLDPRASPHEQLHGPAPEDPELLAALRRLLESTFGYRIETRDGRTLARFVGRGAPAAAR